MSHLDESDRGEIFRGEHGPCDIKSKFVESQQFNATKSLVSYVLDPLQNDFQNEVDVVITESSNCYLASHIRQIIGVDRMLGLAKFSAITQGQSVQKAVAALDRIVVAEKQQFVGTYDLILMVRHDSIFDMNIMWWNVNMSQIAVTVDCPPEVKEDPFYGWDCVDDQLFAIPGKLWKPFRNVVFSKDGCFDECGIPGDENCHTEGHWCLPPLRKALQPLGSDVGFLDFYIAAYPLSPTARREEIKEKLPELLSVNW